MNVCVGVCINAMHDIKTLKFTTMSKAVNIRIITKISAVVVCVVAVLALSGCGQPSELEHIRVKSPNFLLSFFSVDSIKVVVESPEIMYLQWGDIEDRVSCTYEDGKYDNTLIRTYCAKYGDDHYDKEVDIASYDITNEHIGYMEDPVRITVTSGSDFDADHPAGTSLNDLISWSGTSIYPYIKRGYADPFFYGTYTPTNERERKATELYAIRAVTDILPEPITKQLSEITAEDLKIMKFSSAARTGGDQFLGCFGFTAKPEKTMLHGMRIEVELEDGRVLETLFTVDFTSWQPE